MKIALSPFEPGGTKLRRSITITELKMNEMNDLDLLTNWVRENEAELSDLDREILSQPVVSGNGEPTPIVYCGVKIYAPGWVGDKKYRLEAGWWRATVFVRQYGEELGRWRTRGTLAKTPARAYRGAICR